MYFVKNLLIKRRTNMIVRENDMQTPPKPNDPFSLSKKKKAVFRREAPLSLSDRTLPRRGGGRHVGPRRSQRWRCFPTATWRADSPLNSRSLYRSLSRPRRISDELLARAPLAWRGTLPTVGLNRLFLRRRVRRAPTCRGKRSHTSSRCVPEGCWRAQRWHRESQTGILMLRLRTRRFFIAFPSRKFKSAKALNGKLIFLV